MKTTIANIKLSWVTQRAMGREMINVGLPVLKIEPLPDLMKPLWK
ncbi:MAG TPA: hypothetical protein VIX17_10360 [Pyrinomonadaceae bacterium]